MVHTIITNLFAWIPHPIGALLRQLAYRFIFARIGKAVYIESGVDLLGANLIEVGNEVVMARDVRLIVTPNSLLRVGNKVCLNRGLDLSTIGSNCLIEIGDGSYIGSYVCIAGPGNIKIGKNCLIASHTGIYANNHREYGLSREGIEIQDNCWIGSGVSVLDGVTIGQGSVIGAGSVVTKDIPPYSVAVGVPAKVIKSSKGGVA
ncbi:transferase [Nostocales cyanobacterium HT-58-2]|nr:transferase [Nostocales cyanobacterium HT-58-2]